MKTAECRYMLHYNTAEQLHRHLRASLDVPGHLHQSVDVSPAESVVHYKGNESMEQNKGMGCPGVQLLMYSSKN